MYNYIMKIIILEIVAIFPFLLFNQYSEKFTKRKDYEIKMFLDLYILLSHFFIVEAVNMFDNPLFIIIAIIPCIISVLKTRVFPTGVILYILIIFFYEQTFISMWFIYAFVVLLIALYILYIKTSMTNIRFVRYFSILTIFLFVLNYLSTSNKTIDTLYLNLNSLFLFYISLNIGSVMVIKIENTLNIRKHIIKFEKEKELKNSLFKITHEVKNPIAVIKGYLDMFDIDNKEKSERYVKIIKGEVERTLNLLNDFLLFTKVNIQKEVVNFNDLLLETKELLLPFIEEKNLTFSFISEKDIYISLDYNRIKQVILNLLKNSIEATEKYGYVDLRAFLDKNSLIILINDNGCGMTKDTLNSIATPFYTTKQNGTGLGICLSREIIEAHDGKIIYDSIRDKGTTVKIILPNN